MARRFPQYTREPSTTTYATSRTGTHMPAHQVHPFTLVDRYSCSLGPAGVGENPQGWGSADPAHKIVACPRTSRTSTSYSSRVRPRVNHIHNHIFIRSWPLYLHFRSSTSCMNDDWQCVSFLRGLISPWISDGGRSSFSTYNKSGARSFESVY